MARPGTPVRLAASVHAELQQAVLTLSAEIGRRLSMSDVVHATIMVARRHPAELSTELVRSDSGGEPL